ncbi:MAG: hypothetical protein P8K79_01785 [Mariniblastus sp.]|nr:hypothetical protein [Mariniblastus sp.]
MPASISTIEIMGGNGGLPPAMIPPIFIIMAGVIVFFLVCLLVWGCWYHLRKLAFRKMAKDLGLHYTNKSDHPILEEISDFSLFTKDSENELGNIQVKKAFIYGETNNVTIGIFDYAYIVEKYEWGAGERNVRTQSYLQSIMALQSKLIRVPRFHLWPSQEYLENVARDYIKKPETDYLREIPIDDQETFSSLFTLKSDDKTAIRKFFDVDLMTRLTQMRGIAMEGRDGAIIFYYPDRLIQPHETKAYFAKALEIYEHMAESEQGSIR